MINQISFDWNHKKLFYMYIFMLNFFNNSLKYLSPIVWLLYRKYDNQCVLILWIVLFLTTPFLSSFSLSSSFVLDDDVLRIDLNNYRIFCSWSSTAVIISIISLSGVYSRLGWRGESDGDGGESWEVTLMQVRGMRHSSWVCDSGWCCYSPNLRIRSKLFSWNSSKSRWIIRKYNTRRKDKHIKIIH